MKHKKVEMKKMYRYSLLLMVLLLGLTFSCGNRHITIENNNEQPSSKSGEESVGETEEKNEDVKNVERLIAGIGEVTLDKLKFIEDAEIAYSKLYEIDKLLVGNRETLFAARQKYAELLHNKYKEKLVGYWAEREAHVLKGDENDIFPWKDIWFYVYEFDEEDNFRYFAYSLRYSFGGWTSRRAVVTGKYWIGKGVITLNCSLKNATELHLSTGETKDEQETEEWSETLSFIDIINSDQLLFEPNEYGISNYDYYSEPVDSVELWMEALEKAMDKLS